MTCLIIQGAVHAAAHLGARRPSPRHKSDCRPRGALQVCRACAGSDAPGVGVSREVAAHCTTLSRRLASSLLFGSGAFLLPAIARAEQEEESAPLSAPAAPAGDADAVPKGYTRYFGRATSSSSYGGYGGTDENYKYSFLYPSAWKAEIVSKTRKAVNGTDASFAGPKKGQQIYSTSFLGPSYARLKEDRAGIISDLALSDSAIQDALSFADEVKVTDKVKGGQDYVDFDIVTGGEAVYVSVTCDGSRLYALFCIGGSSAPDDEFRLMRDSLVTLPQ